MTDIMKLADKYAEGSAEMREILNSEVGTNETDQAIERMTQQARAELQAAINALIAERGALQAENERLTQDRDEWRDSTIAANANAASEEKRRREMQDQRDALQAKLDALQKQDPTYRCVPYSNVPGAVVSEPVDYYAAPKALEPLTDEKIKHIFMCETGWSISDSDSLLFDFARAIEAFHGIKGTTCSQNSTT